MGGATGGAGGGAGGAADTGGATETGTGGQAMGGNGGETGTGGQAMGGSGAGGSGQSAQQIHNALINADTTGGIMVTRTQPTQVCP